MTAPQPQVPLEVLWQSPQLVAVNKPAGWLSVPSRQGLADARPVVGVALARQLDCRLWPVHRLDFEVSGVLLFAKDADAHRQACQIFEDRLVLKTYGAWTEAPQPLPKGELTWQSRLAKGKKRAFLANHGKDCTTIAEVVDFGPWPVGGKEPLAMALWRLRPLTGRPHQLRFELAHRGWPIIGDVLYGSRWQWREQSLALRCEQLDFRALPLDERQGLNWPDEICAPRLLLADGAG